MYTDEQIDELIKVLVERQEKINLYVLKKIAKRIREIGEVTPSDVAALTRIRATGADVRVINQELARLTALQVTEIQSIIQTVALNTYEDAKPFFDYREQPFIPFKENKQVQKVVKAIAKQTANTFINLSKSQAFMIRDLQNPEILKPTSLSKTYQSVVDEAVQAVHSNVTDYNTAIRKTMNQLIDSGIRYVTYDTKSGRKYTQRLDTAVRRNILDGVREIQQGVQDEVGKQFHSDGKELSAHRFSALDHEPFQGHQFTNENWEKLQSNQDFEDIYGQKFSGVDRIIGIWNCRHFAWSIIVGKTKPTRTKEQLQKFIEDNHKGYTLKNGKHITMYECTQLQRNYELRIRQAREGIEVAKTLKDKNLQQTYENKVKNLIRQYRLFSQDCGLRPQFDKTTIVTK